MTTDTVPKLISKHHHTTDGKEFTITGIAKGAGMIHPNLATMLCVLATDASVTPGALKKALQHSSSNTFNAISVDGDSSTNDSVFVLANGKAGNKVITEDSADFGKFQDALQSTMTDLAKGIVRDGEGATKFVTVRVNVLPKSFFFLFPQSLIMRREHGHKQRPSRLAQPCAARASSRPHSTAKTPTGAASSALSATVACRSTPPSMHLFTLRKMSKATRAG